MDSTHHSTNAMTDTSVYKRGALMANAHSGHTSTMLESAHNKTSAHTIHTDDTPCRNRDIKRTPLLTRGSFPLPIECERKLPLLRPPFAVATVHSYASAMALAGHSPAHVPQLMQVFASIERLSSFSEMAPTGQSGSHVPQFTHFSGSILYAIIFSLCISV